ncbi:hypothetical protein FPV67DRAFT_1506312 [Lyophyllum atratum]|nr:hypothetical protein FPV67DRAFT_1506312 [Lyophyllum atratum]
MRFTTLDHRNQPISRHTVYHLSAAARLTGDVLYLIFTQLKNDEVDSPSKAIPTVSHVCRTWRNVALRSPLLWTSIRMRCIPRPQTHPWLVAHLHRSQNCMVDLHLFATRPLTPQEHEYICRLHAHRFRSFKVCASNWALTRLLWKQFFDSMPLLETYEYTAMHDLHFRVTRDSPKEQHPFPFPIIFRNFGLYWAEWDATNVTSIVLNYVGPDDRMDMEDLSQVLTACRSTLRSLELVGAAPFWDSSNYAIVPVTLPALGTLKLGYADNIVPVVELINAPNLKSLTLRDLYDVPDFERPYPKLSPGAQPTNIADIFRLLQYTDLTELAIFGEKYSKGAGFREFILSMPNIKSLSLYATADEYYKVLFDPTLSEDITPLLSRLLITPMKFLEPFLYFIDSRGEAKLPLLAKLVVSESCEAFVHDHIEEFVARVPSISTIADPTPRVYTPVDERDIVDFGT